MRPSSPALLGITLALLGASSTALADAPPDANRWEPGLLPAINFDSDIGVGVGAIGTLARFEEGYNPYRFRAEALLFLSVNQDAAGDYEVPLQNHGIALDFPGLLDDWLRLATSASFRRFSNTGYYGIGAASQKMDFSEAELQADEAARRFHHYDRIYPWLSLDARFKLFEQPLRNGRRRLEALTGFEASYNVIDVYDGSALARDVDRAQDPAGGGRALSNLLYGTDDHALLGLKLGLLFDTRDHEYAPTIGTFTEAATLISPGVDEDLRYVRFHLGTRWFAPIYDDALVLASRLAADFLVGRPPVYELTRFGVLSPRDGPGGSSSVRGVALQRYHGKIKAISNLELRGMFPWFQLAGERLRLGLVGFVDTGRVWADYEDRRVDGRSLDGPNQPFDVGLGGGGRFQWGETFIVRFDLAHSPTDETTGFYIDLGHVF